MKTPIPEADRILARDWLEIVTHREIPEDEQPCDFTRAELIQLTAGYGKFRHDYELTWPEKQPRRASQKGNCYFCGEMLPGSELVPMQTDRLALVCRGCYVSCREKRAA